jgi:hypothetical protein
MRWGLRGPGGEAAQERITSLEDCMCLPERADHPRPRAHLYQMHSLTHVDEESRYDAVSGLDRLPGNGR